MARKNKWIDSSAPGEPVDEVARRALSARLDSVWYLLSRAAVDDPQPEHVHQLRVATRRATAALRIFDALLPPRRARKMQKQLKRIRRAAGDARNLDVLSARLQKDYPDWDTSHSAKLQEFLVKLRKQAQPPIEKLHKHLSDRDRFERRSEALIDRVRIRSEDEPAEAHTFLAAARHDLGSLVDQFFTAAAADLTQAAALHAMRIAGKRVRYGMEIFGGAFGPALRQEIYPLVVEIQEKLGAINDHVTAAQLYSGWLGQSDDPELAEILRPQIEDEHAATERQSREFLQWWTAGRSAELLRRFDEQLGRLPREQSA
jgi:CHAD domain-containing protein